jgi:anti-sigma factor RsiW
VGLEKGLGMAIRTAWEKMKVEGSQLVDRVKHVIAEGNARKIVIKQKGRVVAEFPLTVGLVGAAFAPIVAAVAALAALLSEGSIEVERVVSKASPGRTHGTNNRR